jgi:hypothetical protein
MKKTMKTMNGATRKKRMQETDTNTNKKQTALTVRISSTLLFAMPDLSRDEKVFFRPYPVRNGISVSTNLREAFKTEAFLKYDYERVNVMIDTPTLMVPIEEFNEDDNETIYNHTFQGHKQDHILFNVIPDLNAVVLYPINKDIKLVLSDHFSNIRFMNVMHPVWSYLHKRSFTGQRRKLYAYFHDRCVDVFAFRQNRFIFTNRFDATHAHDALYYILYTWKQMGLNNEDDELYTVGDIPNKEWIIERLRTYLQRAYVINPTADFNRAPATMIDNMPYDMLTLFVKGR